MIPYGVLLSQLALLYNSAGVELFSIFDLYWLVRASNSDSFTLLKKYMTL